MLNKLCQHLLNYFAKPEDAIRGTFVIVDDTVSPSLPVNDGQRIWIRGSTMNDGVYTYHASGIKNDDDNATAGLVNETFDGAVWPMRVPREVLDLAAEIDAWTTANAAAIASPYTSENVIGVYSYTLKSGTNADGSDGALSWETQFAKPLNRWRKICL